jgi:hypothetical protein
MVNVKKNIIFLICSCIVFSGFTPQRGLPDIDCDAVAGLLAGQPLLQYYFSLSDLPVKIVAGMFLEAGGMGTAAQKQSKKNKRSGRDNTSADFSLAGSLKSGGSGIKQLSRPDQSGGGMPVVPFMRARDALGDGGAVPLSRCCQGFGGLLMLLLMLYVILPRGGLADGIIVQRLHISDNPIWNRPNWVFHLGGAR